jgi:predicted transcriptional regulator
MKKPKESLETQDESSVGVSVRLPAALLAKIDGLADQERRTRGNMIRIALEDWLDCCGRLPKEQDKK